jgi:RNA polymerase sigma factor (sigma-70 family)
MTSRPERESYYDNISWNKFSCRIFATNLLFYNRSASVWKGSDVRTDAELVTAVLDGEKQAFAVLVKRYERPVRAVALDILGDYHSAADVSQEAFVKAYEQLAGLRKPEAFGPWLMKITRRYALDSLRRKPKETQLEPKIAAATESPDGRLDEDKQKLLAAIVILPRSEKQVVMLRYLGDNGVKDVADIVGRSVGTVTKQLSRAHKRLRQILSETEAEL